MGKVSSPPIRSSQKHLLGILWQCSFALSLHQLLLTNEYCPQRINTPLNHLTLRLTNLYCPQVSRLFELIKTLCIEGLYPVSQVATILLVGQSSFSK